MFIHKSVIIDYVTNKASGISLNSKGLGSLVV
jgi:hypothetical protein